MNRASVIRVTAAAGAALLLAACNGSPSDEPTTASGTEATQTGSAGPTATTGSEPTETSTAPSASASADVDNAVAALEQAAQAVPDGQPFDVEQEDEGGQRVWEIKVAAAGQEHTVHVTLDGAEVLDQRQHDTPDDDVDKIEAAEVDAVTALRTAAEEHGGGLDEMEIDTRRDGTLVWEIELVQPDGTVLEVGVDATTGELIR